MKSIFNQNGSPMAIYLTSLVHTVFLFMFFGLANIGTEGNDVLFVGLFVGMVFSCLFAAYTQAGAMNILTARAFDEGISSFEAFRYGAKNFGWKFCLIYMAYSGICIVAAGILYVINTVISNEVLATTISILANQLVLLVAVNAACSVVMIENAKMNTAFSETILFIKNGGKRLYGFVLFLMISQLMIPALCFFAYKLIIFGYVSVYVGFTMLGLILPYIWGVITTGVVNLFMHLHLQVHDEPSENESEIYHIEEDDEA